MIESPRCPEEGTLRDLLRGVLPAADQAWLTRHLDTCVDCQQTLELLAGGGVSPPISPEAHEEPRVGTAFQRALQAAKDQLAETATAAESKPGSRWESVLTPSSDPRFMGRLGAYDIVREIGRGGMGIVFEGYEPLLQRSVAIKVLGPHLARDDRAKGRFLREARAAALVVHENVVTIHAIGETDGIPYLVMEYVPAISLQDLLDESGPLEVTDVLRIGSQTAAGLAAAHARGLVHRDIKPANILLERGSGKVKITDFGLAGVFATAEENRLASDPIQPTSSLALSHTGLLAGTPPFMAPEQARSLPVDQRADLFSFGVLLYALCVGHSPFQGDDLCATLAQVCEAMPKTPRAIRPEIPSWLDDLIMKLLAKDPAQRFASAAEVAEPIAKHLTITQFEAVAPGSVRQTYGREYCSRGRLWGLPLLHVATGIDPHTGRQRVAKGVVAVGDTAIGVVALGSAMAVGGLALAGGMAVGVIGVAGGLGLGLLLALGGVAVGGLALGGLAIAGLAVGGLAIGYSAVGGIAWGAYPISGSYQDPDAAAFLRSWFGAWASHLFPKR